MIVFALDSNIISFYLRGNSAVIENIEKQLARVIIFLICN